ncbi:MAG: thiamine biosynthesis protein ThiS [Methylophaga sp.]|nr:MAG: thiamine biosynthesis protein ThiS [Methylophaga sp.]
MFDRDQQIIELTFNGEMITVVAAISMEIFLQDHDISTGRFVVVVNDEMVPKSQYSVTILNNGDVIDILSPISGG